jgi:hypothetical protein
MHKLICVVFAAMRTAASLHSILCAGHAMCQLALFSTVPRLLATCVIFKPGTIATRVGALRLRLQVRSLHGGAAEIP